MAVQGRVSIIMTHAPHGVLWREHREAETDLTDASLQDGFPLSQGVNVMFGLVGPASYVVLRLSSGTLKLLQLLPNTYVPMSW